MFACAAAAAAADIPVTNDTYIATAQPQLNFGAQPNLAVGGGARALFRFDLQSALPAGTPATQLSKAVLYLYVSRVLAAGAIDVAAISQPWTEATVTSANGPLPGVPNPAEVPVTSANTWISVDVTSLAVLWLSAPAVNFGLQVSASAAQPNTSLFIDAKEAASHGARLVVTLAGPAGPQGPQGPTGFTGAPGLTGPQGSPGVSGLQYVTVTGSVSSGFTNLSLPASCPAGKRVIGGGCDAAFGSVNVPGYTPPGIVKNTILNNSAYVCLFNGGTGLNMSVATTAVCANVN